MSQPVIELRGVCTRFGDQEIHRQLDLAIEAGQIVGLLGGSGSGKTTLLREMLGLLKPNAGSVHLFGIDLNDPDTQRQRALRQERHRLRRSWVQSSRKPSFQSRWR